MRSLKWSTSHAVFVTEIDNEHKEIFEAVSKLRQALSADGPSAETPHLADRLVTAIVDHFAHEERLMRASRYSAIRWHKQQHDNARNRVVQFKSKLDAGDIAAGTAMVDYLTTWLRDHTRLADRMMGAFLRNQQRCVKITFKASTRAIEGCDWVDANGEKFRPRPVTNGI